MLAFMETDADSPELDQDACYRAVVTRDSRFDGRFFTAVKTTGIYCRPVCPARTPHRRNVVFHPSAASAEAAGFRACLRCRPETAPDMGAWRGTSNTVTRALGLIEAGALDEADVETLAGRLGVGERQLRRLFRRHLGAAPVSVAQTRRVLLAKSLIHDTDLTMSEVALASGFGSVRRFNETFQALYDRPPSELRRRGPRRDAGPGVRLRLPFRPPYDWPALIAALTARGDDVQDGRWTHALSRDTDGADGRVTVEARRDAALDVVVVADDLSALPRILSRVRRVFDLSADPAAIAADLSGDPLLAPLVAAQPGLRLAGDWIAPGDAASSARVPDDLPPPLLRRIEAWSPWRAYGLAHLAAAGARLTDIPETDHDQAA
jgi:AraC family transcriptional regulator of adaptative response / DNA-3-methyladenine glycosylase II